MSEADTSVAVPTGPAVATPNVGRGLSDDLLGTGLRAGADSPQEGRGTRVNLRRDQLFRRSLLKVSR